MAVKIGRRAVKCIAFSIVFLLLLQGASMVLVPRNDKAEDSTLNTVVFGYLGEPDHTLDVVMVGNSDLNNGISPVAMYRQYGITSFASGQPRQNPLTAWLRVKEAPANLPASWCWKWMRCTATPTCTKTIGRCLWIR